MSAEDWLVWSNQRNQNYVNAHRHESMETLRAQFSTARQETLDLLEQFTEEQLAAPVSTSFLTNMTTGTLFVANAQHAATHMAWIEEDYARGEKGASLPSPEHVLFWISLSRGVVHWFETGHASRRISTHTCVCLDRMPGQISYQESGQII